MCPWKCSTSLGVTDDGECLLLYGGTKFVRKLGNCHSIIKFAWKFRDLVQRIKVVSNNGSAMVLIMLIYALIFTVHTVCPSAALFPRVCCLQETESAWHGH
jgi:hypothetical protein